MSTDDLNSDALPKSFVEERTALEKQTEEIELDISMMLEDMDKMGLGLPYESFMGLTQTVAFDVLLERVVGGVGSVSRAKFNLEVAGTVRKAIKMNYDRREEILEEARLGAARKTLLMNDDPKVVAIPRR